MAENLTYRSEFLLEVFKDWVVPSWSVLEIGCGDGRNIKYLKSHGYPNVEGVDKCLGTAIEDIEAKEYDVVYTMSCLFLIPPENNWVFKKIASMAKKFIITIEGEWGTDTVFGRNYTEYFKEFGFKEQFAQKDVFNEYGVLRVLERYGTP